MKRLLICMAAVLLALSAVPVHAGTLFPPLNEGACQDGKGVLTWKRTRTNDSSDAQVECIPLSAPLPDMACDDGFYMRGIVDGGPDCVKLEGEQGFEPVITCTLNKPGSVNHGKIYPLYFRRTIGDTRCGNYGCNTMVYSRPYFWLSYNTSDGKIANGNANALNHMICPNPLVAPTGAYVEPGLDSSPF